MEVIYPQSEYKDFLKSAGPIVERMMELVEQSGISAADAEAIPELLQEKIVSNNRIMKGMVAFKRAPSDTG